MFRPKAIRRIVKEHADPWTEKERTALRQERLGLGEERLGGPPTDARDRRKRCLETHSPVLSGSGRCG